MKRHIFLLFFVFVGVNAMAQDFSADVVGKKPIDIWGSKVYVDDIKLDKYSAAACFSSLGGVDRSKDYLRYRAGYKTGVGLTVGGASLAVAGFATSIAGFIASYGSMSAEAADAVIATGYFSVLTGTCCFIAGIPTIYIYKARLNRLEKEYNTSLHIGASTNGLSMAISF